MYHVEINNEGGYLFQVKSKDYEFKIDTKGNGITPPDTLLASLGSCIGVYVRKYGEGAKLNIKEFSVTVDAEFTKEPPFCFKEIKVKVNLNRPGLDERRKKAFLEFIKNCPVHNTLEAKPQIQIEI